MFLQVVVKVQSFNFLLSMERFWVDKNNKKHFSRFWLKLTYNTFNQSEASFKGTFKKKYWFNGKNKTRDAPITHWYRISKPILERQYQVSYCQVSNTESVFVLSVLITQVSPVTKHRRKVCVWLYDILFQNYCYCICVLQ